MKRTNQPRPQTNTPIDHPPEQDEVHNGEVTYKHVLRRTDRAMWPWRQAFYDGSAVARKITHPDGVVAPTMFVDKLPHMRILWRKGWKDVTKEWFAAKDAGWEHGQEAPEAPPAPPEPEGDPEVPEWSVREELVALGRANWELEAEDRGIDHNGVSDDALVEAILLDAGYTPPTDGNDDGNDDLPPEPTGEETPLVNPDELGEETVVTDLETGEVVTPPADGSEIPGKPLEPATGEGEVVLESPDGSMELVTGDGGAGPGDQEGGDLPPVEKAWTAEEILGLDYAGDPSLQSWLKHYDLKANGTKGDLRIRLAGHVGVTLPE